MDIRELLEQRLVFFDGGLGTMLQAEGLPTGVSPEQWGVERPEVLVDVHRRYFDSGSDVVVTNTFGANRVKLRDCPYSVERVVSAAVSSACAARDAVRHQGRPAFVGLDIGPTGKLLRPLGDLSFDDAYAAFAETVRIGAPLGADLIAVETMSDTLELKAAVLAAKENCDLPVFATVTLDARGQLLTGGSVPAVVALLEGLGVDALGFNCGLGPLQLRPFVQELLEYASVPVVLNPNAGLPRMENGRTVYDVSVEQYVAAMREFALAGARVLGGCCGTGYEHIRALRAACADIAPRPVQRKTRTLVSSYAKAAEIGPARPVLIGERINPTGKSRFKQALRENDIDYILREGLAQQEQGAAILDVNVGLPEIDEPAMLLSVMQSLQGVCDLPLQLDTTSIPAMEQAMRYYNGKPMVNSVNGKAESMAAVFPLVKKYGGVVVGLTLDESGIPATVEGRFAIAEKIVRTAESYGIDRKDIVIDPLTLTISAEQGSALVTLETLRRLRAELGVQTVLGVSNISFGLPQREGVTVAFFTLALHSGLTSAIVNPLAAPLRHAYYAYLALAGLDENCRDYITALSAAQPQASAAPAATELTLRAAIEKGLREQAKTQAEHMLSQLEPMQVINGELIPALNSVGEQFERGALFLPQLLMSADAAQAAFEAVKAQLARSGQSQSKRGTIILATVEGDIHDIGKNIVKVLLENFRFDVIDLGKDVPVAEVVRQAQEHRVKLVGLSALMTTTVANMERTIAALRQALPDCRVMVGGAVLTAEYAQSIRADHYAPDAMGAVRFAEQVFPE